MFSTLRHNLLKIIQQTIARTTKMAPEKSIREGTVEIFLATNKVFYNPVQEFNRDLSIAVLNVFTNEYKAERLAKIEEKRRKQNNGNIDMEIPEIDAVLLEALSATGLRSIRYAKEVPDLTKVIANDFSIAAVNTIRENVIHNEVEDVIEVNMEDAIMLMYKHREPRIRFAAVDLDPYGCPTIFLDSAVQCVQDGGLLLVTATDMAVLAGNSPESCYSKYGAVSFKSRNCHEMALRILLQTIEHTAIKYGRYIVPLLSVSVDFYIRVFVKVYSGPVHCKNSSRKMSMVYHCPGCENMHLHPLVKMRPTPTPKCPDLERAYVPPVPPLGEFCDNCNQRYHLGGPIWSAPIHDEAFVGRLQMFVESHPEMFATAKRMTGMLSVIREELFDVPLYHCMSKLFGSVHLEAMPHLVMRSAILNGGYRVSYSHASKSSIKTDAPHHFVWDIVRTWAKTHPPKPAKLESDVRARTILSRSVRSDVQLCLRADANPASRRDSQLRYQRNPVPNWGPGSRAELKVCCDEMLKAKKNQNRFRGPKTPKRDHSPTSDDVARKKTDSDTEFDI